MGAVKAFYEDCAAAGVVPIEAETVQHLERLALDWCKPRAYTYFGHDGRPFVARCITIDEARRLIDEDLETTEIAVFVEDFAPEGAL